MFGKGSRYRNLPESSVLTAQGERLRGKELRAIARPQARFQHTVGEGDRLDLLAFKYYGDPARWWQIADANPEFEFPPDMLDRAPVARERLVLRRQDFFDRFEALRSDLTAFGEVRVAESTSFEGDTSPRDLDFIESMVVVIYNPSSATRQQIITRINQDLHFIDSFAWATGNPSPEAFRLDDRTAKSKWQAMIAGLSSKPGVQEVRTTITEATVEIAYHRSRVSRQEIVGIIDANGFSIQGEQSSQLLRAGSRIAIPPNEIL
jgi:hypothetical protein